MNRRTTLFSIAIVALASACKDTGKPASTREGQLAQEVLEAARPEVDPVSNFLESLRAYNESSVEGLLATYAEEATWHMPGTNAPPVQGRKRIARQGVAFKSNFPESRFMVRRILLMGDTMAAQLVFGATRRFDEQGVAIEPRDVGYEVVQLVETDRGYVRRMVVHHDQVGIRRQMGLISGGPPPVSPMSGPPEIIRDAAPEGWEDLVAALYGSWERGDFASWSALVTDDFQVVDQATLQTYDLAGAVEWLVGIEKELDTVMFERHRSVAAGPWVATFFAQRVDHRQGGDGGEDGPKRISLFGAHVMRLEQGRISRLEIYRNEAEILRETGRSRELLERVEPASDK